MRAGRLAAVFSSSDSASNNSDGSRRCHRCCQRLSSGGHPDGAVDSQSCVSHRGSGTDRACSGSV